MKPVCETCKDTHSMTLPTGSGDERIVPCTRCPTPCEKCRTRLGAYCRTTPCECPCHNKRVLPRK